MCVHSFLAMSIVEIPSQTEVRSRRHLLHDRPDIAPSTVYLSRHLCRPGSFHALEPQRRVRAATTQPTGSQSYLLNHTDVLQQTRLLILNISLLYYTHTKQMAKSS